MISYQKDVTFNNWVGNNCKPSKEGLNISDIDFVLQDFLKKKIMIMEVKTNCTKEVKYGQNKIYEIINYAMKKSYPDKYTGCFFLVFSGLCPDSSEFIYIRRMIEEKGMLHEITKQSLKDFLDFKITYKELLTINNYL